MHRFLPAWRLGALLLFLLSLIAPLTASAGARVTCDDFANPDAAQVLLDADPRTYEDALDPDEDGIACNDDEDDDAAPDDTAYIEAVRAEIDTFTSSVDAFFDTMLSYSDDLSDDETVAIADALNETAAMWADYPGTAPDPDVPDGYEEINDLYLEWVDAVGATGEAWLAYWDVVLDGGDQQDINNGLEAFDDALVTAEDLAADLAGLLDEAEADLPAADAAAPDPGDADSEAYLDDVSTHVADLDDAADRLADILDDPDVSEANGRDIAGILDLWLAAPDAAREQVVPDGYEHIQEAYEDVADAYAAMAEALGDWLEAPEGSDEEEEAAEAWDAAVADAEPLSAAFWDLVDSIDD